MLASWQLTWLNLGGRTDPHLHQSSLGRQTGLAKQLVVFLIVLCVNKNKGTCTSCSTPIHVAGAIQETYMHVNLHVTTK